MSETIDRRAVVIFHELAPLNAPRTTN